MSANYSDKSSSVTPYALTDEQHRDIGRLVRAFAEIEDIVTLRLASVMDITEGIVMVLAGRSSITNKLKTLKFVSEAKGLEAEELFAQAFGNEDFAAVHEIRNTVAHGRLLGLTECGNIAFGIHEPQGIDGVSLHMTAHTLKPIAIKIAADQAEDIIPQMETAFGLTSLRQRHLGRELLPHNMALPPEQRGSELARQRKASAASNREAKYAQRQAQRDASLAKNPQ